MRTFISFVYDLQNSPLGRETVCGQTVSELLELLGLPDILDGLVATARGWICNSILSKRSLVAQHPQALQGYFDTLIAIYYKLKELGTSMMELFQSLLYLDKPYVVIYNVVLN